MGKIKQWMKYRFYPPNIKKEIEYLIDKYDIPCTVKEFIYYMRFANDALYQIWDDKNLSEDFIRYFKEYAWFEILAVRTNFSPEFLNDFPVITGTQAQRKKITENINEYVYSFYKKMYGEFWKNNLRIAIQTNNPIKEIDMFQWRLFISDGAFVPPNGD